MAGFNVHKVTALPGTLEPNALYAVLASGGDANSECYITDSSGVAKGVGNTAFITAVVNSIIGAGFMFEIVADIPARDALSLTANSLVLVTDASADATVGAGAALYAWDTSTFSKLTEFESLDVVLTWASITDGPTSTPAQVDDAVAKATHANRTQLDLIGADVNSDPTYDGVNIVRWATTDW